MAKQRGPVASTFSGRVGNVVGAKLKGGEYVTRSYQPSVKNPNTLRQQASRGRLAFVSGIAAALAPALELGMAKAAQSGALTPRTAWLKMSLPKDKNGIVTVGGSGEVSLTEMLIAKGMGIAEAPVLVVTPADGGQPAKVSVSNYDAVSQTTGKRIGIVYVFMGCRENGEVTTTRVLQSTAGTATNVPAGYEALGDVTQVTAFFKEILESGTEIMADATPWKYPSATSENCPAVVIA